MEYLKLKTHFEEDISKIYEIFKEYCIGQKINFSQEYSKEIEYRLLNNPLNSLSSEDIRDYLSNPKLEEYDDSEIKYFLPRIIELFILGGKISIVDEDIFKIFKNVNEWNITEINILSKFSGDYFNFAINSDLSIDALNLFYIFRFPIFNSDNFFKIWIESKNLQSLISFSNMLSKNSYFQYMNDEVSTKIINWINSEKTKKHFESIIFSEYLNNHDEIEDNLVHQIDYLTIYFNNISHIHFKRRLPF